MAVTLKTVDYKRKAQSPPPLTSRASPPFFLGVTWGRLRGASQGHFLSPQPASVRGKVRKEAEHCCGWSTYVTRDHFPSPFTPVCFCRRSECCVTWEEPTLKTLRDVWLKDEGQDIAEYAVMLAVILVIVIGTVRLIGGNANNVFSTVASEIR